MTRSVPVGLLPRIAPYAAALLAAGLAWGLRSGVARADMTIEGLPYTTTNPQGARTASPVYDRFQNDPSFIGSSFSSTGVGQMYLQGGLSQGDWATMISPSYFISAYHEHPGGTYDNFATFDPNRPVNYNSGDTQNYNPLDTIRFYESNNSSTGGYVDYTNTPSDANNFTVVGHIGGDLWLGKLSTPVPSSVAKYPILANPASTSSTNFYNTNPVIYTFGVGAGGSANINGSFGSAQVVGRNQIDFKSVGSGNRQSVFPDLTDLGASGTDPHNIGQNFRWFYAGNVVAGYSHNDLGADESMVVGGDSGAPDFITLSPGNTMPAIVGLNWFQLQDSNVGIGSGSTFVPGYVAPGLPTSFSLSTLESAMYGSGEQPSLVFATPLKGDFNLDGIVDVADIQAMLSALSNQSGYEALHGISASYFATMGDLDGNGSVTNADIQALISLLADGGGGGGGGGSGLAVVPEPTSLVLLMLGIWPFWHLTRRNSRLRSANLTQ